MSNAEVISICSLTIFSLSLSLATWNFFYQLRYSRVSLTERLHELWWSRDMMETRDEVYAICREVAKDPDAVLPLANYYRSSLSTSEPPGRAAFAKLVGFFCNLEVCLASRVADEKITYRLFAEAHYADYQPLIASLRDAIRQPAAKSSGLPHWLQMTIDLEKRFARQGMEFGGSRHS